MKRSELVAKLEALFGDKDVDIYLDVEDSSLKDYFEVCIDDDGDCRIKA